MTHGHLIGYGLIIGTVKREHVLGQWIGHLPVTAISNSRRFLQKYLERQLLYSVAKTLVDQKNSKSYEKFRCNLTVHVANKCFFLILCFTLYLLAVSNPVNASKNSTCCLVRTWSTCNKYSKLEFLTQVDSLVVLVVVAVEPKQFAEPVRKDLGCLLSPMTYLLVVHSRRRCFSNWRCQFKSTK